MTTTTLTGATRLTDLGIIRAQGEEAAKFLHSQLTQDFALLGKGQARLAGFCSAKGRLLATLIGWKTDADDEILLALPAELLPTVLKRLSMFVLRAKCKLTDASADWQLWGAVGAADETPRWAITEQGIRLPDAGAGAVSRWLIALPAAAPAPALPALDAADWQWGELESGLPWVRAATVEQFVPQMLNFELLGGVNFQKGCYPGQEVVARSQYRGTLKRRTYLYELDGAAAPGQEIFHSEDPGQPAGIVANATARGGKSLILAETKIAALETGSLHLGAPDGPLLAPRALPYALTQAE